MINQLFDELVAVQNNLNGRMAQIHLLTERAMTSNDPATVKQCRDQIAAEIKALNRVAAQMYEIGQEIENRKAESAMRTWILIVVLLIVLLLGTGAVVAQEATREPGPLQTLAVVPTQIVITSVPPIETGIAPEPTRVPVIGDPIVLQPGSADNTWFIVTTIAVMLFTGLFMTIQQRNMGALLSSVERALQDQRVQDEAERRYIQSSASFQDLIKFMHAAATYVGSKDLPGVDSVADAAAGFLDAITDGQPNTGQALTAPKVPQYDEGSGKNPLDPPYKITI